MFSCQLRHWIVTKITTRVYCMSIQLNDNWLQLQLHEKSVQLTTQLDLESLLNHTAMCSLPLTHMAVHLGLYKPSREHL